MDRIRRDDLRELVDFVGEKTDCVSLFMPLMTAAGRDGRVDEILLRDLANEAEEELVQRGLRAGANAFVEFGRHESAIGHFHATLDERLGDAARCSGTG